MIGLYLKLGIAAAVVVAVVAFIAYERHDAAGDALNKVEKQNNAAGSQANESATTWDNCVHNLGGVYDFETGKCSGTSKRNR